MIQLLGHVGQFLLYIASIALFVSWIVAIVEVARIPGSQFYVAGSNKVFWLVVIGFVPIIGAVVWLLTTRSRVLAADEGASTPPPGWYPNQESSALRWWDGVNWTDRYNTWTGESPE